MKHHVHNKALNQLKDKLWPCKLAKKFIKVTFTINENTEILTENNLLNYGCVPVDKTGNPIPDSSSKKDKHIEQPCYRMTLDFKKSPQVILAIANQDLEFFENNEKSFGIKWTSLKGDHKIAIFDVIDIEKGDF